MAFAAQAFQKQATSWDAGKHHYDAVTHGKLLQGGNGGNDTSAFRPANGNPNDSHLAALRSTLSSNRLVASRIRDFPANGLLAERQPTVYTQRKTLASTPGATQDPRLLLSHSDYGLPKKLVSNLQSMGINLIYPWQANCLLRHRGVLQGTKNWFTLLRLGPESP